MAVVPPTHTPCYAVTRGEGTGTLVWLHGWGQSHSAFSRMIALFDKDHQSIAFDLPGFGKSPPLFASAGSEDYADHLAAQLETFAQQGPAIIIGHSYGGRVAVHLAAKYPHLTRAIILIGASGIPRKRSIRFKIRASLLKFIGRLARLSDRFFSTSLHQKYSQRFGSADYRNAGMLKQTFIKAVTEDMRERAQSAKPPALLIYGANDTEAPSEIGRKYEAALPNAHFVELDGYDHWDILDRGAYQCEALMRRFMKDIAS